MTLNQAKSINANTAFKFYEVKASVAARAVNDEQFALAA